MGLGSNLTQARAFCTGRDFAPFDVHLATEDGRPICSACRAEVAASVKYREGVGGFTIALRSRGIDWTRGNLVLKNPKMPLGIDCGCYAKFQRQIAHIEDIAKR